MAPEPTPAEDPMGYLASRGVAPPSLDMVGITVPEPDDFDNDPIHIAEIDDLCLSDAYDSYHPLTKLLLKQHRDKHLARMNAQAQAIALQGGGEVNPEDQAGAGEPPDDMPDKKEAGREPKPK